MAKTIIDNRNSPRIGIALPLRLNASGAFGSLPAETINLSEGGLCLAVKAYLPNNLLINIHLNLPSDYSPIIMQAQVIWSETVIKGNIFRCGVRFSEINQELLPRLKRVIEDASSAKFFPLQTTLFKTTFARITASGSYLPKKVITNKEIIPTDSKASDMILRRALGAQERHAVAPGETGADMMAKVAQDILNKAECSPEDIDRIICSADPGDNGAPDTAVAVQNKIGASCPAHGISMSCSGWLCGVDEALRCIETGEKRILVLASSAVGSWVYFHNFRDRAIFGDGAAGVLLETNSEGDGLMASELWTEGKFYSEIFVPYPWSQHPSNIPSEYKGSFYMCPDPKVFFGALSRILPPFFNQLLLKAGVSVGEIDHFLLHQASKPLFEHSLKLLCVIPRSKVFDSFAKHGNIVAAEMPLMLSQGIQSGRIKRGDLVLMITYGAGFTMAGLLMRY